MMPVSFPQNLFNKTIYQLISESKYTTILARIVNEDPDLVDALYFFRPDRPRISPKSPIVVVVAITISPRSSSAASSDTTPRQKSIPPRASSTATPYPARSRILSSAPEKTTTLPVSRSTQNKATQKGGTIFTPPNKLRLPNPRPTHHTRKRLPLLPPPDSNTCRARLKYQPHRAAPHAVLRRALHAPTGAIKPLAAKGVPRLGLSPRFSSTGISLLMCGAGGPTLPGRVTGTVGWRLRLGTCMFWDRVLIPPRKVGVGDGVGDGGEEEELKRRLGAFVVDETQDGGREEK
ncbi:hypothetical protein ARAM_000756, partial [Aspergillus rambellii]